MREIRESKGLALGILVIVSAVALLIGAESVRSDGPLPIQRVPDEKFTQTFVDTLNQMEKTEARKSFDMMEADWDVFVAGYRQYLCHLHIAPDIMRVDNRVYEADCGPLYELLNEIIQLRKAGKID